MRFVFTTETEVDEQYRRVQILFKYPLVDFIVPDASVTSTRQATVPALGLHRLPKVEHVCTIAVVVPLIHVGEGTNSFDAIDVPIALITTIEVRRMLNDFICD